MTRTCRLCQEERTIVMGAIYCADCRRDLREAAVAVVKKHPELPTNQAMALLSLASSLFVRSDQ